MTTSSSSSGPAVPSSSSSIFTPNPAQTLLDVPHLVFELYGNPISSGSCRARGRGGCFSIRRLLNCNSNRADFTSSVRGGSEACRRYTRGPTAKDDIPQFEDLRLDGKCEVSDSTSAPIYRLLTHCPSSQLVVLLLLPMQI